jgi:hypothetical protein
MEQKKVGIDLQVNTSKRELIEKNRSRLRPIIDAIIIDRFQFRKSALSKSQGAFVGKS